MRQRSSQRLPMPAVDVATNTKIREIRDIGARGAFACHRDMHLDPIGRDKPVRDFQSSPLSIVLMR